jgi:hypothetical protein
MQREIVKSSVTDGEFNLINTVEPVYDHDHPWDPKLWPLLPGGRYLEVICVIKLPNGTSEWWSL